VLEFLLGIVGCLLEASGEFLLQLILEALVEFGMHTRRMPHRGSENPWIAVLGYGGLGFLAGSLSLLIFPAHLLAGATARIINLAATPCVIGIAMSLLGDWRARRGQVVLRIDRFACGYSFALALAIVRFIGAK
jgi:hypothetical protein